MNTATFNVLMNENSIDFDLHETLSIDDLVGMVEFEESLLCDDELEELDLITEGEYA